MKTTALKSFFVLTCLALFAAGCGKSGGGGGSNYYVDTNNLNASGQQAFQVAQNWYNSTAEGTAFMAYNATIKRTKYNYTSANNNQNCETKKFLGIPYTYCSYSSSSSSQTSSGEVVSTQTNVNLYANNTVVINSKGNVELNNIFNGSAGTLVQATTSGNVIRLDYVGTDGSIRSYIIDRSYHSLLNPVQIMDQSSAGASNTITTASGY